MPLPSFFLIGAPKAGSTSLYYYVGQHPEVFTSAVKEPGFFWTYRTPGKIESLEKYEELFRGSDGFRAVGEGSPTYFADPNAPRLIKELVPDAKLVAILRDPYERAFSQYVFLKLRGQESEGSLLAAVEADNARQASERTNYVDNGLYHRNLSRYLSHFDRSLLKVVFLEDLEARPDEVVSEVFSFLGVDPGFQVDTSERLTQSGVPRRRAIHWLLSGRNPLKKALAPFLPKQARKAMRRIRTANLETQAMSKADRRALSPYFEEDIKHLEQLLVRDLSHWKVGSVAAR